MALAFLLSACASGGGKQAPELKSIARDYSDLGDQYFSLQKYDKAEAAYRKALDLDPGLAIGSYQLARTYAETGQTDKCLSLSDLLLKSDPKNSLYISLKAYALLKAGNADEAWKAYKSLSSDIPYGQDVLFNTALLDFGRGKTADAMKELDLLLSQRPDDKDALLLKARCLFQSGDEKEGRLLLNDYLVAKPEDASALKLLARSYMRTEEYGEALKGWEKLQASAPADPEVWFSSAVAYALATEEDDKGQDALQKALDAGYSDKEGLKSFLEKIPDDRRGGYARLSKREASPVPASSLQPLSTPRPSAAP